MLKIFTTQLTGLLNRMYTKNQEAMEDGARLLAQASIANGQIFVKGFHEMMAVEMEAVEGAEPMHACHRLLDVAALSKIDRVLIVTRASNDGDALALASQLTRQSIPFVVISNDMQSDKDHLTKLADVHIDTCVIKGLIPTDDGGRSTLPHGIAALYCYHGLKLSVDEMMSDYD